MKTTEVRSLTALEAPSLKSSSQQGQAPSEVLEKNPPLLLPSFWWWPAVLAIPWLTDPILKYVLPSSRDSLRGHLRVCVPISLLLQRR